jgi:hypothetical protein
MRKYLCLTAAAALLLFTGGANLKAKNKIKVCHVSPDEGNHIIAIPETAYPAHLAHGDQPDPNNLEIGSPCQISPGA